MAEFRELGDLAVRLRRYMTNYAFALPFVTWGMLTAGYWLVAVSVSMITGDWLTPLLVFIVFMTVPVYVYLRTEPRVGGLVPREGLRWLVSFLTPLTIYLLCLTDLRPYILLTPTWYPYLGLSLLLAHVLIERHYHSSGLLVSRPLLLSSVAILATTPVVVYISLRGPLVAGHLMATGLALLIYYGSAVTVLDRARRIIEGG